MARLSVALCTYNGETFLEEQLQSFLTQTRLPDELVVRDDCSSDRTLAILHDFSDRAPFPVRILVSDRNLGYVKNFETCIAACSGDLIALSDQDDVWLPNKLSRLEEALGDDSTVLLAFSDAVLVGESLEPLGKTVWESIGLSHAVQQRLREGGAQSPLLGRTLVTGATVCFRASLVPIALPIDLIYWHDAWLALIASLCGRIEIVKEPLVLYRQHSHNTIGIANPSPLASIARLLQGDLDVEAWTVESAGRLSEMASQASRRLTDENLTQSTQGALNSMMSFHSFRQKLNPYPWRAGSVLWRLWTGKYHAYGTGFRIAVRDLFRP